MMFNNSNINTRLASKHTSLLINSAANHFSKFKAIINMLKITCKVSNNINGIQMIQVHHHYIINIHIHKIILSSSSSKTSLCHPCTYSIQWETTSRILDNKILTRVLNSKFSHSKPVSSKFHCNPIITPHLNNLCILTMARDQLVIKMQAKSHKLNLYQQTKLAKEMLQLRKSIQISLTQMHSQNRRYLLINLAILKGQKFK